MRTPSIGGLLGLCLLGACSDPPVAGHSDAITIVPAGSRPAAHHGTSAKAAPVAQADADDPAATDWAEDAAAEASSTAARAADPYRIADSVVADAVP